MKRAGALGERKIPTATQYLERDLYSSGAAGGEVAVKKEDPENGVIIVTAYWVASQSRTDSSVKTERKDSSLDTLVGRVG